MALSGEELPSAPLSAWPPKGIDGVEAAVMAVDGTVGRVAVVGGGASTAGAFAGKGNGLGAIDVAGAGDVAAIGTTAGATGGRSTLVVGASDAPSAAGSFFSAEARGSVEEVRLTGDWSISPWSSAGAGLIGAEGGFAGTGTPVSTDERSAKLAMPSLVLA
jgi:hypothetical protein